MNHYQMQLKMQYQCRVVENLLLDFPQPQVLDFIKVYGRFMESRWERKECPYETAKIIRDENYNLLVAYKYQEA